MSISLCVWETGILLVKNDLALFLFSCNWFLHLNIKINLLFTHLRDSHVINFKKRLEALPYAHTCNILSFLMSINLTWRKMATTDGVEHIRMTLLFPWSKKFLNCNSSKEKLSHLIKVTEWRFIMREICSLFISEK